MLSRCEDDDYVQYKDYGGRGIFVCEAWHGNHTAPRPTRRKPTCIIKQHTLEYIYTKGFK